MSRFMLLDNRLRQSFGLDNDEPSSCVTAGVVLLPFISVITGPGERHSCQVRARSREVTVLHTKTYRRELLSRVVKDTGPREKTYRYAQFLTAKCESGECGNDDDSNEGVPLSPSGSGNDAGDAMAGGEFAANQATQ